MPSQIKGTALQTYVEWLRARLSAAQADAIFDRLSAGTRLAVTKDLLPSVQYRYEHYAELLEATQAIVGLDYERLAFDHGRWAADALLAGIYRMTVKVGDVERTLQSLARGWRLLFDTGEIEIVEEKPGRYVFMINDAQYHRLHPPISAGYVERACEIAGASRVEVELYGAPPQVEMTVTWS